MSSNGVSAGLRNVALVVISVAVIQTLLNARLGILSWYSAVLTAVTLVVVLVPRTPLALLWLVLVANAALVAWFSVQLPSAAMGLLYATILLPFTARVVAVACALLARRDRAPRPDVDDVPDPLATAGA